MKRTRLRRLTPLKSGKPLARKTRMKRVNPKTAKLRRQAADPRKRYVDEHFTCQLCHKRTATQCHEIVTRANNATSINYRATYLALCGACHGDCGDYSRWPVSRQMAAKLVGDAGNFCLETINKLRGRAQSAITLADVAKWLRVN